MSTDHIATAAPLPLLGTPLPDDGDPADAASVGVAFETILDALQHIGEIVDPSTSTETGLEIVYRMAGVPVGGTNANVSAALDDDDKPSPAIVCTGTYRFSYLLDLPHGSGLRQIRAYFYEDTDTTTVSLSVIRRDYESTTDVGDVANVPTETVLGTSTTKVALSGGMSYVAATFSAHEIDRDTGADYFVRVSGVTAGAGVRWMPKIRQWVEYGTIDKGAA